MERRVSIQGMQTMTADIREENPTDTEMTSVSAMYRRWTETEALLAALLDSQQSGVVRLIDQDPAPIDERLEDTANIAAEQLEIVKGMTSAQSLSIDDAVHKLRVWRDLIAPEGQEQDSDQLVLSLLSDLEALKKAP